MPVYSGDPLTPGVARDEGRRAPRPQGRPDDHEDPGAADLLRRRASRCSRPSKGRSRREDWRGALPITYRVGPGTGEGPPQARLRLEARSRATTSSRRSRGPCGRTSGSSAATTTTPGSTAPRTRSAGLVRAPRGGPRVRTALSRRAGGRSARSCSAPGTARSRGSSARPSGPRPTPDELRAKAVAYINTDGNGRGFLNAGGSHSLEGLVNGGRGRRSRTPRRRCPSSSAPASSRSRTRASPRTGKTHPGARRPRDRGPRLGLGLHALPPAPRHRLAQPRLRRRKPRAASTTRSTTTSPGTRVSATPTSSTPAPSPRPAAR